MQRVEEATKGRVKIELYPSQTLIKGTDMWKGVRGGIADIGWCVSCGFVLELSVVCIDHV